MYREWKEIEFPKGYYIWIWEQQDWEVDQETDGKMRWERMDEELLEKRGKKKYITGKEEAPENGKELSHSAHADGMNEWIVPFRT